MGLGHREEARPIRNARGLPVVKSRGRAEPSGRARPAGGRRKERISETGAEGENVSTDPPGFSSVPSSPARPSLSSAERGARWPGDLAAELASGESSPWIARAQVRDSSANESCSAGRARALRTRQRLHEFSDVEELVMVERTANKVSPCPRRQPREWGRGFGDVELGRVRLA
ncbi:hypothetical protein KM043_000341 [Ampulex compressa]|nr:hypothetical protein KM043_000341 [Ampulex compressa]